MISPADPIPASCGTCRCEVSHGDESAAKCVSCGDLAHDRCALDGKRTSAGWFCDGCWSNVEPIDKMKEARNLKW